MLNRKNKSRAYPLRTRFAGEIVAEVVLPERQTGRVAICAFGLPSLPSKRGVMQFLADQGYVVICPRYRGTWESAGFFLAHSPADDIRDVIRDVEKNKSITDVVTNEIYPVRVKAIHLVGSSFGGPAVLLNTSFSIVKKVIAISPVLDWMTEGRDEPFDQHIRFVERAFGEAYRLRSTHDWQKLRQTDFYDPLKRAHTIDGKKIFILHAQDDTVVPPEPIEIFTQKTKAQFYLKPHGGHTIILTHQFIWKKIQAFLAK